MKNARILAVVAALAALEALAQVPAIVNYQGRLAVGGTNVFDGPGLFKFALVSNGTNVSRQATASATVSGGFVTMYTVLDGGAGYLETPAVILTDATGSNATAKATVAAGAVTKIEVGNPGRNYSPAPTVTIDPPPPAYVYGSFWSNDGTSTAGSEPAAAVPVTVSQGLFSVNLGDTTLSNMTAALNPTVFTNPDIRLRIWFNDGSGDGFQQFYPDQKLSSAPYAMVADRAGTVADGAITSASIAPGAVHANALAPNSVNTVNLANSAVTSVKLAPGAVEAADLAANSVATTKIQDNAVTAGKLASDAASLEKVSGGTIFSSGGKIGIGTPTPQARLDLGNAGRVRVSIDPGDDTTQASAAYLLSGRTRGGGENIWAIYTAPAAGGRGIPGNSFSIWQYPTGNNDYNFERLTILPAPSGPLPTPVTIDAEGKVTAKSFQGDGSGLSNVRAPSSMSVFTSSGTWVRPAGVTKVHVKLWGGGGGGYVTTNGGGGGAYCEGIATVTENVEVTVGRALGPNNHGTPSSFLSLTAGGGTRGLSTVGGTGGSASGGVINLSGQNGLKTGGGDSPFGGGGGRTSSPDGGADGGFPGGGGHSGGSGGHGLVIIYY